MTVGTFFDGTDDFVETTTGVDLTIGAITFGGLVYIYSTDSDDSGIYFHMAQTTASRCFASFNGTTIGMAVEVQPGEAGTLSLDTYGLIFCTKATGAGATPRLHYTFDGSAWTHVDLDSGAQPDANGVQDRITFGCRSQSGGKDQFVKFEVATYGIWGADTSDGNIETLDDYTALVAKANREFFTGESMINGGTMTDISSHANNETARTGATTGVQTIPAWFTNFGGGPVPPTPITMQQVGTLSAGGTTSLTIAYPVTGLAAGDLFLTGRTVKPETATSTTPPSPFTALTNTTGGTGTTGIDTGPTRLTTEYLISPAGAETGNLTTAQGNTPNSAVGRMIRFRKPNGTYWATPLATTADDNSHGTARSAAGIATLDVREGDMLVAYFSSDTDTATAFSAGGFTGTGLTVGTVTIDSGAGGVGTGNDSGIYITHALVTAATTNPVTITATLTGGPSSCGATAIIRLRAIYPVHFGREPRLTRVGSIVPILSRRRR